ncbi:MAG: glycosyltransferase, partial [Acetobacteraceae bacterium]
MRLPVARDDGGRAVLSVVIPALNAARSLPATLGAVVGTAAEILVVDGGSTDPTAAVARGGG